MTRSEVRTAVLDALREAEEALAGQTHALPDDANPFDAIDGLDSLATVEVTATICVTLGIADTDRNPFLEHGHDGTIANVIDAFCSIAGATEG
jgi:hypothetical protein